MSASIDLNDIWPGFTVEDTIGRGAYGTVYKIKNDNTGECLALKVLSIPSDDYEMDSLIAEGITTEKAKLYYREMVREFINEIEVMELLRDCTNIVKIRDYKVVDKKDDIGYELYLRMELLTPFISYMAEKPVDENTLLKIMLDLTNALRACAEYNIIHRDIKPENIFVSEDGSFKLGDFGIARKMENVTSALSQKGTFNYMAPEVISSVDYDCRVDIYSLGILSYKLLNDNKFPFIDTEKQLVSPNERKTAFERRIRGEKLPAPKFASSAMAAIILKACEYNPDNRYASAQELYDALFAYKPEEKSKSISIGQKLENAEDMPREVGTIGKLAMLFSVLILSGITVFLSIKLVNGYQPAISENIVDNNEKTDTADSASTVTVNPERVLSSLNYDDIPESEIENYQEAAILIAEEKYNQARQMLRKIGNYKAAHILLVQAYYEEGVKAVAEGDLDKAGQCFMRLGTEQEWLDSFLGEGKEVIVTENISEHYSFDGSEWTSYADKRCRYEKNKLLSVTVEYIGSSASTVTVGLDGSKGEIPGEYSFGTYIGNNQNIVYYY